MSVVDSGLRFLQEVSSEAPDNLKTLEGSASFGFEMVEDEEPMVKVLVQFNGDISDLAQQGLEPRTVAGDVATGMLPLSKVESVAGIAEVVRMEVARPMSSELDTSIPEIQADLVHTGPPGNRGSGVIIGIIDSGIDIMHQSFRRPDGGTRILALWDQFLSSTGSESNPTGYSYGVEYSDTDIDASITAGGPPNTVRHEDIDSRNGHGTHVAGIAAGDGSIAGNGEPALTYVGVAPEADIIFVRNDAFGGDVSMGDSANSLDAVKYIFDKAASLNRPVVINMSQGDNIGPHDGSSLLERGIDNLLGSAGKIMVKSAGNEGARSRHAGGSVTAGGSENVRFNMPNGNRWPDTIDIWYDGPDRFSITITSPDGNSSAAVNAGSTITLTMPNGNRIFVDSTVNNPNNNDNRIYILFQRGTAATIQAGNWSLSLTGISVSNGRFDAWIDRNISPVPRFISNVEANGTISIPGTSREVITAGSYITTGAGIGSLSTFSSRGPTRDGRVAPTLSAPGQWIMSTRADGISSGSEQYHQLAGTSMAAPHITGTVALMLARNRNMTQQQIRDCLVNNTRVDSFTGTAPNNEWGGGKLNCKAAVDCARPTFKIKFTDDLGTQKFIYDHKFKFADDPHTFKFIDDPKFKFSDDPLKQLGLDKPPGSDTARTRRSRISVVRPRNEGERNVPFILSTPHHSNAWAQSYPDAYEQTVCQLESTIKQYEEYIQQVQVAAQNGQLSEAEMEQTETLYQDYERLVDEYQQVISKKE